MDYDKNLGADRHDKGAGIASLVMLVVVSGLLVAAMLGVALVAKPSSGASAIDSTYPVAGSVAVSTPVRGNFSIAKSEISALQAKFPASSGVNNIASYADTSGALKDAGVCGLTGTTNDTRALVCGGRLDVNFAGSTGDMANITGTTTGNGLGISQLGTGNVLQTFSIGIERFTVNNAGSTTIWSDESGPTLTLEKSITQGDLVAAYTSEGYGLDVRAATGTGDASRPVMQFETETSNEGEAAFQLYQNGDGRLTTYSTVTDGLDPYTTTWQQRRETTNGTATAMLYSQAITSGQAYSIHSEITALVTAGTEANKVATYKLTCAGKNISGTTSLVGTPAVTAVEDSGITAFDVTCTANDTTDKLEVKVTGAASQTVTWHEFRRSHRIGG